MIVVLDQWKKSLNLFTDNQGLIRSRSRLPDTEKIDFNQGHPVVPSSVLPLSNHFTKHLILYKHNKVCHGDVDSTLIELLLKYWIIKGGQTVWKIINPCVTYKKVYRKVLRPPTTPSLPEYLVCEICQEFSFRVVSRYGFYFIY